MSDPVHITKAGLRQKVRTLRQEMAIPNDRGWMPVKTEWLDELLHASAAFAHTLPEDPPEPDLIVARVIAHEIELARAAGDEVAIPDYAGGHYDDTKTVVAIRKGLRSGMDLVGWKA